MVVCPVADLTDAAAQRGPLVIIGCGNLNRSDDGVGVRVLHRLREAWASQWPGPVKLFDGGTGGLEVMFQARGAAALLIIDASRSGSPPGAVFCLPGSEIDGAHQPAYSLHDFRWDHALYAGRRILRDDFPSDVTVYLVEAGSLDLGTDLTPPVADAVDKVCRQVDAQVRAWCASVSAPA